MSLEIGKTAKDHNHVKSSPPVSHNDSTSKSVEVSTADSSSSDLSKRSVLQGHQAIPVQGHQALPVQGHQAVPVQGHQDLPVQGHQALPVQGHQALPVQGHQAAHAQGQQAAHAQGHQAAHAQGRRAAHAQGRRAAHAQGHRAAHAQGRRAAHAQGHQAAHAQGHQAAHAQGRRAIPVKGHQTAPETIPIIIQHQGLANKKVSKSVEKRYGDHNQPRNSENENKNQRASEPKEGHSSTGKRPREDKDDHPPLKKNPANNNSELVHLDFITSIKDEEDIAGYDSNKENSMNIGLRSESGPHELLCNVDFTKKNSLDSVPDELLYQQNRSGIQSRTSHPRRPLIVSGKQSWHLPIEGISSSIWHGKHKIVTVKEDETFRLSKLLKHPALLRYIKHLKGTYPGLQGYYLKDRATRRCIFSVHRDCDLDLVTVRHD